MPPLNVCARLADRHEQHLSCLVRDQEDAAGLEPTFEHTGHNGQPDAEQADPLTFAAAVNLPVRVCS